MSFLPDCREMSKRLSQERDGTRALSMREYLHLLICDVCTRVREQFRVLSDLAKKSSDKGPSLSAEAKDRLKRKLNL